MGDGEWGMGNGGVRSMRSHPSFVTSASRLPLPPSVHSLFPIPYSPRLRPAEHVHGNTDIPTARNIARLAPEEAGVVGRRESELPSRRGIAAHGERHVHTPQ